MFPTLYKNSIKGFLALLTFIIFLNSSYSQQNILPDTIRSCKVDSLIIDAGFGYKTYNWSTGDTTQAIWVSITGQYKIDVNQGDTLFIEGNAPTDGNFPLSQPYFRNYHPINSLFGLWVATQPP